jgi:hypothetical protein
VKLSPLGIVIRMVTAVRSTKLKRLKVKGFIRGRQSISSNGLITDLIMMSGKVLRVLGSAKILLKSMNFRSELET